MDGLASTANAKIRFAQLTGARLIRVPVTMESIYVLPKTMLPMNPPVKNEHKAIYGFLRRKARCVWAAGTPEGPCARCTHAECIALRDLVACTCTICGRAIGYEIPFVEGGPGVTHTSCFMGVRLNCGTVH